MSLCTKRYCFQISCACSRPLRPLNLSRAVKRKGPPISCVPQLDHPSRFCRISEFLENRGGSAHISIMPTLLEIFPDPKDLLALEREELAGILIEIVPGISQAAGFMIDNLTEQVFLRHGN